MNFESKNYLKNEFGIDDKVLEICESVMSKITPVFDRIDSVREYNQYKVIRQCRTIN